MSDSVVLEIKKTQFMGLIDSVIRMEVARSKKMGKSLLKYTDNDRSIEECFNGALNAENEVAEEKGVKVENEVNEPVIETEGNVEGVSDAKTENEVSNPIPVSSGSEQLNEMGVSSGSETANMSSVVKSVLASLNLGIENVPSNMSLKEAVAYLGEELVKNGYPIDSLSELLDNNEINIEPNDTNVISNENECINGGNSEIIGGEDSGIELEGEETEWSELEDTEESSTEVNYVSDDFDDEVVDAPVSEESVVEKSQSEVINEVGVSEEVEDSSDFDFEDDPYIDDDIDDIDTEDDTVEDNDTADEDDDTVEDDVNDTVVIAPDDVRLPTSEVSNNEVGVENTETEQAIEIEDDPYIDDDIDDIDTEDDNYVSDDVEDIADDVIITQDDIKVENTVAQSSPSIENSGDTVQTEPISAVSSNNMVYIDDDFDEDEVVIEDEVTFEDDDVTYEDDEVATEEDVELDEVAVPVTQQTVVEQPTVSVAPVVEQPISPPIVNSTPLTVTVESNQVTVSGGNNTVVTAPILNDIENSLNKNNDNGVIYDRSMSLVDFLRKNKRIRQKSEVLQYFSEEEIKKAIRVGKIMLRKDRIIL